MGQQTITSGFRSTPLPTSNGIAWNIGDQFSAAGSGSWTLGGTLIDQVSIQPALTQSFSIIGWTISFYGNLGYMAAPPASPVFGALGRLLGGIVRSSPTVVRPSAQYGTQPWVNPALPVPAFPLTTLWDGATDPPFPATGNPPSGSAVTFTLPVPLQIEAGETVQMGLWLTPGLVAQALVGVHDASYAIVYDDGLPQQRGWGG